MIFINFPKEKNMCGRYQAWVEDDELMRIIEREKRGNVMRYFRNNEVFPGSIVPVLYGSYSTVRAHLSVWGYDIGDYDGSGSDESEIGAGRTSSDTKRKSSSFLINARAETAAVKPMFKDAAKNAGPSDRRIIVLTSGYYEWKADDETARKIKYHITNGNGEPLLLAGLETTYEQDSVSNHHVILTTAALGSPARIHHRMPLFLRREEIRSWLYDTDFALHKLRERIPCDLVVRRAE